MCYPYPWVTPKQERFVAEYLVDLSATQAAIRAGYRTKRPDALGYTLLRNGEIAAAVATRKAQQLAEAGLSGARVLEEYRRLSFIDVRSFFDETGNLKPITEWSAEQGAAAAGFEVIKKNVAAGDGVVDTIHKVRLWDKTRALESLAKHFGLLVDKLEHSGTVNFRWQTPEE